MAITGPPGAGKTTVAVELRRALGLPLLAKDTLKEALAPSLGVEGREASQRLGAVVFELLGELLRELLGAHVSMIVEGNFRPGTTTFERLPPARVVQVHVTASPAVVYARNRVRAGRHPVHHDVESAELVRDQAAAGLWQPLPLAGELVRFDTTCEPPVAPLVARVKAFCDAATEC